MAAVKTSDASRLTTTTKLIFGFGDWGTSAASTARNVFWFVFLTNVVGLNAGLAGGIWLVGRLWDAINDPLVGSLSDRLYSRWGRRRPFLLVGSIPFAFFFFLMFVVPPLESKTALVVYYSVIFLLYDTLYTVVNVPYLSLVPELAEGYDERSSLTGWRTAFSFLAQLVTAGAFKLLAEHVFAPWFGGGPEGIRLGYMLSAALWAVSMALPFILLALTIREPDHEPVTSPIQPWGNFREVFQNRPFRLAALIYLLCFTTGDLLLLVFVRYLIDYVQMPPGLDDLVLVVVLGTSLLSIPFVLALMRRTDKRTAYLISISFMVVVLAGGAFLPPGGHNLIFVGAVLAGIGFADEHYPVGHRGRRDRGGRAADRRASRGSLHRLSRLFAQVRYRRPGVRRRAIVASHWLHQFDDGQSIHRAAAGRAECHAVYGHCRPGHHADPVAGPGLALPTRPRDPRGDAPRTGSPSRQSGDLGLHVR